MTQQLSDAALAVVGDAAPLWGDATGNPDGGGGSASGCGPRPPRSPAAPPRSSGPSSGTGSWGSRGEPLRGGPRRAAGACSSAGGGWRRRPAHHRCGGGPHRGGDRTGTRRRAGGRRPGSGRGPCRPSTTRSGPALPVADRIAAVRRIIDGLGRRAEEMAQTISSENGAPDQLLAPGPGRGPMDIMAVHHRGGRRHPLGGATARSLSRLPAPAGAGRRGRGHRGLERPPGPDRRQAGSRPAGRLHGGDQGRPRGVARRHGAGRDPRGRRPARRDGLRAHRRCGRRPGLVAHPGVDKIAFTGSTAAGREIGAECGRDLRRCSLELGGKSAAILLDDADLDGAARACGSPRSSTTARPVPPRPGSSPPARRYDEAVDAIGGLAAAALTSATRTTRTPRWARWSAGGSATGSAATSTPASRRGPAWSPAARGPRRAARRMVRPAHGLRRRRQRDAHRPGGDLRPRAQRHPLRRRCRRGAAGQRLRATGWPARCSPPTPTGAWPWPVRSAPGPSGSTATPPTPWPPSAGSRRRGSAASGARPASTSMSSVKAINGVGA